MADDSEEWISARDAVKLLKPVTGLGFRKAIIVLEEGCEKFSNIEGLGDIRFPRGSIKSAFNEVREILEREGTIQKN
jgi:hypothetical protein